MQEKNAARVVVLAEGEYEVPIAQGSPPRLSDLLDELGVSNRDGQLIFNGRPVTSEDPVVEPGSETLIMPFLRGG
jgi:hypothetical protein